VEVDVGSARGPDAAGNGRATVESTVVMNRK